MVRLMLSFLTYFCLESDTSTSYYIRTIGGTYEAFLPPWLEDRKGRRQSVLRLRAIVAGRKSDWSTLKTIVAASVICSCCNDTFRISRADDQVRLTRHQVKHMYSGKAIKGTSRTLSLVV